MKKLAVIVPYRNRPEHLELFKRRITRHLDRFKDIPYELIIVNQDDGKMFNRGMLLNIGFKYAEKMICDYVVFHDVDMIPLHVDYSYSDIPLHLATGFKDVVDSDRYFDTYFGGVTMFNMESFRKVNGFSNRYWGWGYEDDDLLLRCKKFEVPLQDLKIKNKIGSGKMVKFNGVNSYVRGKNTINLHHDTTIFVSFYPDNITCNTSKENDIYTTFSIPGYDFSISYNSFARYNFTTFDEEKNVLYVSSKIKTNYKTNICITLDFYNKEISLFQDGQFIGKTATFKKLYPYSAEPYFYLGAGNPERHFDPHYFKGYIDAFMVFSEILSPEEIMSLSNYEFGKYVFPKSLELHYDAKVISGYRLIDLSGKDNDGELVNCEISVEEIDEYKTIQIPTRRESEFILLPHEENGFENNRWKTQATRWNQLRYYNEITSHERFIGSEGLRRLEFIEYGKEKVKNVMQVNVGI